MKRDNFIKLIQNNFQKNDEILFGTSNKCNFITQRIRVKNMSVEKYKEKEHKFIEENKKVILLIL